MLINSFYFRYKPIYIPFSDDSGNGISVALDRSKKTQLDNFIARYEKIYLTSFLGSDLYDAFMAGLSDPDVGEKWNDLKSMFVDETLFHSPIANYVYYNWVIQGDLTDSGMVIPVQDKTKPISPVVSQVNAWNEMVMRNELIADWLYENKSVYESYGEYPIWIKGEGLFEYINRFGI